MISSVHAVASASKISHLSLMAEPFPEGLQPNIPPNRQEIHKIYPQGSLFEPYIIGTVLSAMILFII